MSKRPRTCTELVSDSGLVLADARGHLVEGVED